MQKPLHRIRLVHTSHPRAETSIRETVSESAEDVAYNEHGVRRMQCQSDEGDEVADGRHYCNAPLAKFHMNGGIGECCNGVARKGREEDEGYDGVA